MQALRQQLRGVAPQTGSTHLGLWLDRYLPEQEVRNGGGATGTKADFVRQIAGLKEPAIYAQHFNERRAALDLMAFDDLKVEWIRVKTTARIVSGLGAASVIENGFSIHHTYGVPILPGSGLKGLSARVARQRLGDDDWKEGGKFHRMVFGDMTEAGGVEFFDALPVPTKCYFVADVLTPHHRDYQSDGSKPPADWDSPIPISFLSASGTWEFALYGPAEWLPIARQIVLTGLKDEGFGAKTSSGFGRMEAV